MTAPPFAEFHEFERRGWENPEVVGHYARDFSGVTRQSNAALLEAGGVRAGARVLDVACGPGALSAAVAALGASVVGVDFSSAQVEVARRAYPALRFEVGDAGSLPFGDGSFEVVLCCFGMLHFPDAAAAAREARRVLAPGGRFAFTVWDQPERAVGMGAVLRAVRAHGRMDVEVPAGPDFFGLSDPERSARLLVEAGFVEPEVRSVAQVWRLAEPEQTFEVFARATVRLRALLQAQSAEQVAKIRAALRAEIVSYRDAEGYAVPMPALLSVGRKPA